MSPVYMLSGMSGDSATLLIDAPSKHAARAAAFTLGHGRSALKASVRLLDQGEAQSLAMATGMRPTHYSLVATAKTRAVLAALREGRPVQ